MKYWAGKIIGGAIGFYSGNLVGLVLGVLLGNAFDRTTQRRFTEGGGEASLGVLQSLFFQATFTVMGKIAKSDGRVSEKEIELARHIMARMALSESQRLEAMRLFNQGKSPDFAIDIVLADLADVIGRRVSLAQIFLEIQLLAAYADGQLTVKERDLLQTISTHLSINRVQFEIIHQRIRAQMKFSNYQQAAQPDRAVNISDAYKVLGVEPNASDVELKRAYRRLMSQHHPDKLVAKGLPKQMMELAKERTQEIQQAYEEIRKVRKAG